MTVETQRIRAAQIISNGLSHLSAEEAAAVISLVAADILDRIASSDEAKARLAMARLTNAALHIWGMVNDVDIPLSSAPATINESLDG